VRSRVSDRECRWFLPRSGCGCHRFPKRRTATLAQSILSGNGKSEGLTSLRAHKLTGFFRPVSQYACKLIALCTSRFALFEGIDRMLPLAVSQKASSPRTLSFAKAGGEGVGEETLEGIRSGLEFLPWVRRAVALRLGSPAGLCGSGTARVAGFELWNLLAKAWRLDNLTLIPFETLVAAQREWWTELNGQGVNQLNITWWRLPTC
jgi:hypothetical protein